VIEMSELANLFSKILLMDLKLDTSLWITDVMSDTVGKVVLLSIHGLLQKYL